MKKRERASTPSVASLITNQLSCTRWSWHCIGLKGREAAAASSTTVISPCLTCFCVSSKASSFFCCSRLKCEMSELNSNCLLFRSHHAYKYCCPLVSRASANSHQRNPVAVCVLYSCLVLAGCFPSDTAICFPLCNGISLHWLWCGFICRLKASPPTANRSRHLYLIEQLLCLELQQNKETCRGFFFSPFLLGEALVFRKARNLRK